MPEASRRPDSDRWRERGWCGEEEPHSTPGCSCCRTDSAAALSRRTIATAPPNHTCCHVCVDPWAHTQPRVTDSILVDWLDGLMREWQTVDTHMLLVRRFTVTSGFVLKDDLVQSQQWMTVLTPRRVLRAPAPAEDTASHLAPSVVWWRGVCWPAASLQPPALVHQRRDRSRVHRRRRWPLPHASTSRPPAVPPSQQSPSPPPPRSYPPQRTVMPCWRRVSRIPAGARRGRASIERGTAA